MTFVSTKPSLKHAAPSATLLSLASTLSSTPAASKPLSSLHPIVGG